MRKARFYIRDFEHIGEQAGFEHGGLYYLDQEPMRRAVEALAAKHGRKCRFEEGEGLFLADHAEGWFAIEPSYIPGAAGRLWEIGGSEAVEEVW